MTTYIVRRVMQALPIMIAVSFLVFMMSRLMPGDPAAMIAGPQATPELVENIRQELGLDEPMLTQYWAFLTGLLQGDLGNSILTKAPVTAEIGSRLGASLQLAAVALVFSSVIGLSLGLIAGSRPGSRFDKAILVGSVGTLSIPNFWLGLTLLVYLAGQLGWFPVGGNNAPSSVILPAITLALPPSVMVARLTRANVAGEVGKAYVWSARAKGASNRRVMGHHVLRNALLPAVTMIGLEAGSLLSGVIVIETVFAWPGIGTLLINSLMVRDYPVIQGLILFFSFVYIFVNLAVDVLYGVLDPRTAHASS